MITCLICNKEVENNKQLGAHMHQHKIAMHDYKVQFNLYNQCPTCNKILLDDNKTGFCYKHFNRTGVNNPFFGKKHKQETIDNNKIKCREATKKLWKDPTYREKVVTNTTGKTRSDKFKQEQSKRITQWYRDNPDQLEIRSNSMKNSWELGKITQRYNPSINRSKAEHILYEEINKFYSTISRPCLTVEGRWHFPDIFIPDLNLIIEYYGDYWHANPKFYKADDVVHHNLTAQKIWDEDNERIKRLQTLYTVDIIWEEDFKNNKDRILFDIDCYINWDSCSF